MVRLPKIIGFSLVFHRDFPGNHQGATVSIDLVDIARISVVQALEPLQSWVSSMQEQLAGPSLRACYLLRDFFT